MSNLNLAVIGNCSYSALIDSQARIVWCCLPRFDSEPRFSSLLNNSSEDAQGVFAIDLLDMASSTQRYRPNTAIVETELHDSNGSSILITDFAPRFKRFGRVFRPAAMMRQVKTLSGTPRIRVRVRPTAGFSQQRPEVTHGSNHIRYVLPDLTLRLTTNASVNYILEEVPFNVDTPLSFFLGPDESLTVPVTEAFREYCQDTEQYWIEWSRYLSLPFEWQDEVNRAAISLKLSHFEETGAVIAAPTTSIPEAPDSGRNWDYRFCWLRDSYFVVHALNALGATKSMEGYLNYIMNIAAMSKDGYLQPVFGITLTQELHEAEISSLAGYRNMGPVRVGNDAYRQVQNDGYGSVILSCAQTFFDSRLSRKGDVTLFRRLEVLGYRAQNAWDQPDAGLWELRQRQEVHTYSSVMCWAACDRLAKIGARLGLADRAQEWNETAARIGEAILEKSWNAKLNSFTSTFGGDSVDAVLLLLPALGIIKGDDPRFAGTVAQIEKDLLRGNFVARYSGEDDFGKPQVAFNACTFWYIDALAMLGRRTEARALFENMLALRNPLGLLSEDIDPVTGELWGNFPQTYSMVGLIHSAMKLSRPWEDAF
ncbi:MAG: glycoside hydrolase family 15 protein [Burkholderiales bacterium]